MFFFGGYPLPPTWVKLIFQVSFDRCHVSGRKGNYRLLRVCQTETKGTPSVFFVCFCFFKSLCVFLWGEGGGGNSFFSGVSTETTLFVGTLHNTHIDRRKISCWMVRFDWSPNCGRGPGVSIGLAPDLFSVVQWPPFPFSFGWLPH